MGVVDVLVAIKEVPFLCMILEVKGVIKFLERTTAYSDIICLFIPLYRYTSHGLRSNID